MRNRGNQALVTRHRLAALSVAFALIGAGSGCFREQAVVYRIAGAGPAGAETVTPPSGPIAPPFAPTATPAAAATSAPAIASPRNFGSTRQWLQRTHAELVRHLPAGPREALLTEQLVDESGSPRDVNAYYDIDPQRLHTVIHNLDGLKHSSQASGTKYAIDAPADPWPGFQDEWIPISDKLSLSVRIGWAREPDGTTPRRAPAIAILPGIYGDNSVMRTQQIARALLAAGYHAVAVEQRGCGQTEKRYPKTPMTFGTFEAGDLLAVSEWLEDQPQVIASGLIGFCWGSNVALVTGWEDGRRDDDPAITPMLRERLRPRSGRRHFSAGILVFSASLPFEEICEKTAEKEWSFLGNPVLNKLQKETRTRQTRRGYQPVDGNLWRVIDAETGRDERAYPKIMEDGLQYLRLYPYRDKPCGDKLEAIRVPTLIVHGCNDPLVDAQPLANVIAKTQNPLVAAIVLPGGGHVGFGPYSSEYFYGLILRFFDPARGAAGFEASAAEPQDSMTGARLSPAP